MGKKEPQEKKVEKKKVQKSDSEQLNSEEVEDLYDKPVKEKAKNGQEFWALTKNKRISISTFKGKAMVNIRQYFQKDGEWFPTKKGISLANDSWKILKKLVKDIDQALQKASN